MFSFVTKNRELILALISIFAFVLSTGQLIYNLWKNKCRLKVIAYNYEFAETRKFFFLSACICNMSSAPVAVTKISILDRSGVLHPCTLHHVWMGEQHFPKFSETDIPRTERTLSADFPLNLVGHESSLHHLAFKAEDSLTLFHELFFLKLKVETNKKTVYLRVYCPPESKSFLSV